MDAVFSRGIFKILSRGILKILSKRYIFTMIYKMVLLELNTANHYFFQLLILCELYNQTECTTRVKPRAKVFSKHFFWMLKSVGMSLHFSLNGANFASRVLLYKNIRTVEGNENNWPTLPSPVFGHQAAEWVTVKMVWMVDKDMQWLNSVYELSWTMGALRF